MPLLLILTLTGCNWDNGLSSELPSHLDRQGISITVSRSYAPLTRRGGFLVSQYDAETASKIISVFKLERCQANESYLKWAVQDLRDLGESIDMADIKECWVIESRPPQLELDDGGQFEDLYLLATQKNEMYLLASYAFG